LGAHFVRPISWVIDDEGIYYDASTPSRLESLLRTVGFDAALIERASALREAICVGGITKYNVGSGTWVRPAHAKRVILVPGQVETDASIRFGASIIRRNMDLLQAARSAHPDAYLLYKPHPDVQEALRKPGLNESSAQSLCDEVVKNVPMERLLDEVDEVHVMTSLAGFEALLRGKHVVCHGQPFYAGWGLTEDVHPPLRRQRKLTLDELVAVTLILYPTYISRTSGKFTTPEGALRELMARRARSSDQPPLWQRVGSRILRKR
jgi:capsular polysaccharide export protein